ncbi:putative DNA binding protein [uncultured Mediterranean phage uvMED]|jgi:hypothetical protein|uniref:Uncharacterized protein n=1 Tax=uncultured organism MedDCM-OCT-S08-C700 TaxID=743641 RepID=D6PKT0_9ZZZZ|nr:hypothetical protein P9303_12751 [uncultured organism MedDCM-OCT-S08-C700]BAQ92386.1 putative DNA binding protein [uncultured Mediterranean phage uvMED]BAR22145.1 putative DNA binding protein [uncultured Mediterranean phage uvMED]BAR22177.1 putative DNA binding protein [uncultured Mediterranean phage uvMED]BAR22217.1 putative DNA binding protein [uncultured Mediterranean phage uvMED]|tara:strand:- start:92 stop:412 length:321 start_codon:yes stop_codon:yes gene_type:complete
MAKKGTKLETVIRSRKLGEIIAKGGRRSDCNRYASENWGVGERSVDKYLEIARAEMKADWDMERPEMVANLLAQAATLQMEAREKGQLHIALGAINTAARLAQIIS